jgi:hypothetical protein
MKKFQAVLLLAPIVFLSCGQEPKSPTASSAITPAQVSFGTVGASAVGDVKVGSGDLEIFNVRMDRQNASTGASILRQYANPGGIYQMAIGERIELWVEYRGAVNPRVRVDWGAGGDQDGSICGGCLYYHTYPAAGLYNVVVTVDDQAGTTVRRTFALNSLPPDPGRATLNLSVAGTFCDIPHLLGPGGLNCTNSGGTCSASFTAGTSVTLTWNAVSCTAFAGWSGACAGVGTGAGTSASCTLVLPAGSSSVTLSVINIE